MQKKFKQDIVKKVKEEVLQEKRQEALKEKYEIADDVVVVEKSNMIKWTIRTMVAFIRCICAILIFLLSLTGGCFGRLFFCFILPNITTITDEY